MLQRLQLKFHQFMIGRNGMDRFNLMLLIGYLLTSMLSTFFRRLPLVYAVIYLLSLAIFGLFLWRFFSKNTASRSLENERFLRWYYPKQYAFTQWNLRRKDKEHKYVCCKACKQRLRLPKHRGKLQVTCPKCHNQFTTKT